MPRVRNEVAEAVRFQCGACSNLGSAFYAGLLERALEEPDTDLPFWSLLDAWPGNPNIALTPLRLLGAVHDLVLADRAPALAALFPRPDGEHPAGDVRDWTKLWQVVNQTIARERERVHARLDDEIQTNEVRRCAALLPGFLWLGARFGLPLRLAELGASAGLNLCWDRYRYRLGPHAWGQGDAPLELETQWSGDPPPRFTPPFEVASRRGCDIAPLDVFDEDDCRRLRSFIWPDQFERRALFERALAVTRDLRPALQRARAGDFVDQVLTERREGQLTVVYHSIMWLYVPEEERNHIEHSLRRAGAESSERRPLAWLRMEFVDDKRAALLLDCWPDGSHTKLGDCHYHGTSVSWRPEARPG